MATASVAVNRHLFAPAVRIIVALFAALLLAGCSDSGNTPEPAPPGPAEQLPNIITIITDDTGIDQFTIFGYGGDPDEQAKTPNIDAIGRAGVRFRNTWSHPSCGPTRSSILNGRYTLRNNVLSAPVPPDLPNSQVSPYEHMIPTVLKTKNYVKRDDRQDAYV